jgi:hypothetical protein
VFYLCAQCFLLQSWLRASQVEAAALYADVPLYAQTPYFAVCDLLVQELAQHKAEHKERDG